MRSGHASDARFAPTHWSVVLAARRWPTSDACEALARLCEVYWYPLYAFIRRQGHAPHDAEDLTQAFFAHLFENETLRRVDREKGKFRTFLLAALNYFLQSERTKQHTLKRGGHCQVASWDALVAEERFRLEPSDNGTATALFERCWAMALVEQALDKLQGEYTASDKADVFAALEQYLTGETGRNSYARAAAQLTMTEGAVKVALHRLRRRFGELLRAEIGHTVARPEDVDEEIRCLFAAIAQ